MGLSLRPWLQASRHPAFPTSGPGGRKRSPGTAYGLPSRARGSPARPACHLPSWCSRGLPGRTHWKWLPVTVTLWGVWPHRHPVAGEENVLTITENRDSTAQREEHNPHREPLGAYLGTGTLFCNFSHLKCKYLYTALNIFLQHPQKNPQDTYWYLLPNP